MNTEQRYAYTAAQSQAGQQLLNSGLSNAAPPAPTRLGNCAEQLEVRVSELANAVERLTRVADHLGGPVPEEAQNAANKIRGGGNIAAQIECSLEDFDMVARRLNRTVERLEQL